MPIRRVKSEALREVLDVRHVAEVEFVADFVAVHGSRDVLGVDHELSARGRMRRLRIAESVAAGRDEGRVNGPLARVGDEGLVADRNVDPRALAVHGGRSRARFDTHELEIGEPFARSRLEKALPRDGRAALT